MPQKMEMGEGVECQAKGFGLSPVHWVVRGQGKRTSIYISQHMSFDMDQPPPQLKLGSVGVKQLESLFANHRRA